LVLFQFLSWIDQLAWARKILNGFFALFALGVGLFSLRDAWLARQGRLQDMTLQLPGFLKARIRSTIRGGARQARYILAAFTSGIIISLLELACTGQVYAPIIHAVQQGARNAIGWLLLYNLAFITPLVLIFLLAFAGMKANALIAFQQKHTALVKLLLGLLFIGLFLLLAFGSHLLPGGRM
jgi:cytochrome c biogenesis protein CcdA